MFSVTYEELRRLASTIKKSDASYTLNPTALVNEAWLKLAKSPPFETTSRLHFKRIAARAMRQVLIEAARRRNAGKRGGQVIFADMDLAVTEAAFGGDDCWRWTRLCRSWSGWSRARPCWWKADFSEGWT